MLHIISPGIILCEGEFVCEFYDESEYDDDDDDEDDDMISPGGYSNLQFLKIGRELGTTSRHNLTD